MRASFLCVGVAVLGAGPAAAADAPGAADGVAALAAPRPPAAAREALLPKVLGPGDAARYRAIFARQDEGDWGGADALIARLSDRLLMGHVLAQRYLHPTRYRSSYAELAAWLERYADHPDAVRIHGLALKRKPARAREPKAPSVAEPLVGGGLDGVFAAPAEPRSKMRLGAADRQTLALLERRLAQSLRQGHTKAAKELLQGAEARRLFDSVAYDRARARLGLAYFNDGDDEDALRWSGAAADRSGRYLLEAHWTAGLAAWRLGRLEAAARHFEAVAAMPDPSGWTVSAGAFWAARAHLVDRRPAQVMRWLAAAAEYPRTFYGILAGRVLGRTPSYRWDPPPLEPDTLSQLLASPPGRRAVALAQVGEAGRSERELRGLATGAPPELARGLLALAARADMPALAMRLDRRLNPRGGGWDAAAFPVPSWMPEQGFSVDRALVYALVRQESAFNPKALSVAGASGLMQLMPGTASFVAGDRGLRGGKRQTLFEPEVNLALGQKYIEILLADDQIKGDLFLLAAAWNGGPGNLGKWRRRVNHMNDPLFFIESVPVRETRLFIERVLANLWIYRNRFGQPTPSLDAIAAGQWPVYTALDSDPVMVADRDNETE